MSRERSLGLLVALLAGFALAFALGVQHFQGLSPCPLCLMARWPYRVAIGLGLAAMILPPRLARPLLWLALLCFAADVAIGFTHLGVESGWWPSPLPECSGPDLSGLTGAALLAALPARPAIPCDAAVYPIPALSISMVEMSLAYAMLGFGLLISLLLRKRPT